LKIPRSARALHWFRLRPCVLKFSLAAPIYWGGAFKPRVAALRWVNSKVAAASEFRFNRERWKNSFSL
jgi:hypothetical protein